VGKAKRKGSACLDGKEEGRNYRGWEKETLAAYESPLGSKKESDRKEISTVIEPISGSLQRLVRWFGCCVHLAVGSEAVPAPPL
jgi:hypothetical protein